MQARAQTAFVTLPLFRQRVQTYARTGAPSTSIRTFWRLGLNRRLVATIEWLRLCPKPGFLAQTTQTRAMARGSIARNQSARRHVYLNAWRNRICKLVDGAGATGGSFAITNDVIAQIVGLSVLECYGVVGMAATSLTQGVARLLSRERLGAGRERPPRAGRAWPSTSTWWSSTA